MASGDRDPPPLLVVQLKDAGGFWCNAAMYARSKARDLKAAQFYASKLLDTYGGTVRVKLGERVVSVETREKKA